MGDYEFKEEVMRKADKQVLEQVLMYFKHLAIRYNLPYKELTKLQDTFIYNYVELSKYQKDEVLLLLKQKNCNQQALLDECIYEALSSNPLINNKYVICSITDKGFVIPPVQKYSHILSILFLKSVSIFAP